jgi:hypothetical protein
LKSLRSALIFIGLAGFAIGLLMAAVILTSDHGEDPVLDMVLILTAGWSFIGTGLFTWWRRPNNRTRATMAAAGFAWFFVPLTFANTPEVFIVGIILNNVAWIVLAQLLLVFPSGKFEAPSHRILIGLLYLDAIVLQSFSLLFRGSNIDPESCDGCPPAPSPR